MKLIMPTAVVDNAGTFTSGAGTYFDENGVLLAAAVDEPRFSHEYVNGVWVPTGLLLEDGATNLLLHSSDFSNAAWSAWKSSVAADVTVAPDGTMTADKLVEDASMNSHTREQAALFTVGAAKTFSSFVKAAERSKIVLNFKVGAAFPSELRAWFDLESGSTNNVSAGVTASIAPIGSGWYHCSVTATPANSGTNAVFMATAVSNDGFVYAGDGVSGIYVWGAQLSDRLTSYIPTTSAPVARAADVLTASMYSSVPENDYTEWSSGTAYVVGNRAMIAATHKCYEALTAHTNKPPATNPTDWLDLGSTNRWAMFDQKVGTVTTATTEIVVALQPGLVNAVALLNVDAATVRVTMTDPVEGLVFDESASLYNPLGIDSWHAYFFEDVRRKTTLVVSDLPAYANAVLQVIISGPVGSTVSVGSCVVGKLKAYADAVNYGASVGIQDYSRKEADAWGNYYVVERAFAKRARWSFLIANADLDLLQAQLSALRATPAVYIGSGDYDSTILYGFYRDFDVVIPYPNHSECSMDIEGLT